MATFEDCFLADLDELSDSEPELEENDAQKEEEEEEEEEEEDETIITTFNYDDLDRVAKLQKTQRFSDIMQKVEEALDFDSEYKLLVDCKKLLVKIDKEISILDSFIRHNYRPRSPTLDWIVPHAIHYARVVKRMGYEMELDLVDLPIGMVDDAASFICGEPLPKDVQEKTLEACDRVLDLDSSKKKVLEFVEIKTRLIAPNLAAIFGCEVATKLMVSAGGLAALAKMPPTCNVQRVGQKRKRSFVGSLAGLLNETEIIQNTPPRYQDDACELLAAKLTSAARVDSTRGDSSGARGRTLRDKVLEEIGMLQGHKRVAVSSGTRFLERRVKEQPSIQSPELDDGTQSKYFSKFGTFSKVNKISADQEKVYKF
ncbi:hypothetical protein CARUB_v10015763mg [Capsella rubella]|uniref:Nop domain-containing protein n=1 Tax=Capsella rubella TaxID=81985 RepID=R0I7P6_9BRAS|nr:U4/U6 small nuclear ribonucleoprotein Prp31 homolog [Capsella rubella]EOA32483.1 hypothetical protein CARUB_v10015763mg [Capsella rubella]